MRKATYIERIVLLVLMGLVLSGQAFAESEDDGWMTAHGITAGATVDVYSKYIWRGQNLVDDPVLQPGAYVSAAGFTASIWGDVTLDGEKEFTELDYTLDYTTSLGVIDERLEKVSVSGGYIYYDFPNLPSGNDSQEVYAGVAVDTLLSPSFTVYYDYDEGDGTYYEASVSHSVPLDPVTLDLSATVGYNDGQWGYDSSFSAAALGAGVSIPIADWISIEPSITYSVALDNQYDDEFYGGFSVDIHPWN